MIKSKIKLQIILYNFLFNFITITSQDKIKNYIIRTETINLSNFKNIIYVPNFIIADNNIIEKMKNYINNTLYKNIFYKINKKIITTPYKIGKENKISYINNENNRIIKKNLENIKKNHFLPFIFNNNNTEDNIFSEKKTLEKCKKINQHFIDNGFLDSETTYNIEHSKNYIDITYNVIEGEIYKITKINILAKNSEIKEIISKQITSLKKKNTIYNKKKIDNFKNNSIQELNNKGFFYISEDNYKIHIYKDSINKNIEIYICIIPKDNYEIEKFKYGDIILEYIPTNDEKFKKKEILYKVSKPINNNLIISKINLPKGEIYNKTSVNNSYFKLYDTEIFDSITINFLKNNNYLNPNFILKIKKPYILEYASIININKTEIDTNNNLSISFRNLLKRMEIIKLLISYWQTIPFKKKYKRKYPNKISLALSFKYPFSLIFGKKCKSTNIELLFKKKPLIASFKKSTLKSYLYLNYNITIKNFLDFSLKLTPFYIKKTIENITQSKSIILSTNIKINNIFFNKLDIEFNNSFSSKKYINYFKLLFKRDFTSKNNSMLKIVCEPKLIIKPTQESELITNLIIGKIFLLKNITSEDDNLFQLGGENYLKAWNKGEVGLYNTKNGKGNILLFLSTEFNYNITNYINLNATVECGNIWLNETTNNPNNDKYKFKFNKKLFKELYLDLGPGVKIKTGIIDIKIDLLIKILNHNKIKKEPYKIRIKINN